LDKIEKNNEDLQMLDRNLDERVKPKGEEALPISDDIKHKQAVEKGLISKAYWLVVAVLVAIISVYIFDTFTDASMTSDIITILSTVLTMIIGFLFGAARK